MIKTTAMILEELKEYASPANKLARMAAGGEYIQIVKGIYETDKTVPPHLLAGSIYGPSYISFEYALSYYGLIPETVYTITCASFEKKKKKKYETPFGTFTYRDVPPEAFPLGLEVIHEGEYFYRIATAEKALCDKLYTIEPMANLRELRRLLVEDMRIDESELQKLDKNIITTYGGKYHSTNIYKLVKVLGRISNE